MIGATFSYDLLKKVTEIQPEWLAEYINKLIISGLIYKRGGSSDAVYVFKHAMVRDAAYSTLLKSDRQQIHSSIARALVDSFPAVAESQPELVAHHFTEAQLYTDAAAWWLKAGKLAGTRFAVREAISHLKNGLRLVNCIALSAGRDKLEYKLQLAIWPHLVFGYGPASKDAILAQERLTKLMPSDEPFHRRLYVLAIDFLSHCYLDKPGKSEEAATKLLAAANQARDPSGLCVAHAELALVSNFHGKFQKALHQSDLALSNHDRPNASIYAHRFGWEPAVVANCQKGLALLCIGMLDDAQLAYDEAIGIAESLDYPAVTIDAWCYAGLVPAFLTGNIAALHIYADRCLDLGKAHNTLNYLVWSYSLGAVAFAENGNIEKAIQSLETGRSLGENLKYIGHGSLMKLAGAIVYSRSGDVMQAFNLCQSALNASEINHENWLDAELWRMKGDLHRQSQLPDLEVAQECYRKGLSAAKVQGAGLFALKCALSLARLLRSGGREREARDLLQPIYNSFLQGRNCRWLREARGFLEEMS